jgi:membrane associated rhomboid family serine protease
VKATALLVVLNLAVFGLELAGGVVPSCEAHGLVPAHFALGAIFSSMLLHASWMHLAGNLAALAVFGGIVEGQLGSFRLLAIYLAAGVGGALLHVLVNPASTDALVGCSGCVFGLIAVASALRPRLIGFALGFVGVNLWYAFAGGGGAVSFGDHLGGFFVGFVFAALARANGNLLEAA